MTCPSCHRENPPDNAFCGGCGARLESVCPGCGRANPPGDGFCGACGQSLGGRGSCRAVFGPIHGSPGGSPSPPSQASSQLDPRSYTPKHLAEKILASKSVLEGERKQVTVLFADVKGSMDLAEQVDAEDWHRILNKFFEILTEGVHRFEGTVNQYTGDGIMALFGAPIAHEDHAHRACYAALHLQSELQRYARSLRLERGLDFAVRMGINSGEVIVGKIGDDLRMDYTAQGHTVGLAARLEQLAEASKIYLTEHTASLVGGFFQTEDLGPVRAKGVRDAVRVFELSGVGPMRTRLDVSRARGLSRFVGRDQETAMLEAALERAVSGQGQVIGVVAEPGTGKSRLCLEFSERCRARGITVRETHALAHARSIPYLPILELMRGFFGVTDRDADDEARHKIAGRVLLLDEKARDALPALFQFLGVPDPKRPAPVEEPEARQRRLLDLVRAIVRARSQEEPGVTLFEDLHWIDAASETFLEGLIDTVGETRTVLLLTFRPEYRAPWMEKSFYQQIALQPLGPEAMRALLEDLLGRDPSIGDLPGRIEASTGGNPFFVEEVVQSLVEAGTLEGSRGAYRLARSGDALGIPSSVQAVLAARIDRLPEREKRLLQTAAVIGKRFGETLLGGVADLPETDLREALHALQSREFVYPEAIYPQIEYAFKHPLTQEVAYRSQLSDRRARIHGEVARALTELHADKADEHAALLAHHWESAGERLEAARWHARAARWAGTNHPREAFSHWRGTRDCLEGAPESPDLLVLGAEACSQMALMGHRTGGLGDPEIRSLMEEAGVLAERSGNPMARYRVVMNQCVMDINEGRLADGSAAAERAMRIAEEAGIVDLLVTARFFRDVPASFREPVPAVIASLDETLALTPDEESAGVNVVGFATSALVRLLKGFVLLQQGRLDEGARELDRGMPLARRRGDLFPLAWGHYFAVALADTRGDPATALDHGRRGVEATEKVGSDQMRILGDLTLGYALLVGEQWREAADRLDHALRLARERRNLLHVEGLLAMLLARAALGLGDLPRARSAAEDACASAMRTGARLTECDAHVVLARVLLCSGAPGDQRDAEDALDRAQSLADLLGKNGAAGLILIERGRLARLRGDEAARERFLREAHRAFTEMGATGQVALLAKELAS